jgi:hypothetical protein
MKKLLPSIVLSSLLVLTFQASELSAQEQEGGGESCDISEVKSYLAEKTVERETSELDSSVLILNSDSASMTEKCEAVKSAISSTENLIQHLDDVHSGRYSDCIEKNFPDIYYSSVEEEESMSENLRTIKNTYNEKLEPVCSVLLED